jgi:2-dehydro-3-deoxyphosphogluconate aldolase / (4S)-4-hydroxy-2-oxoglutarate aldolase
MNKHQVRARIEEIGILPVIRAASAAEAHFAVDAVLQGGVNVVEITMTVPGATEVIRELVKNLPEVLVGAGTVLDVESAQRCLEAGAQFLVSPGLDLPTVAFAVQAGILILPGALTPSEVMAALKGGADMVKVFPCAQVGGALYIKALKGPFPNVPFVPTGGVNLNTAAEFIRAGAAALGAGGEMVPKHALKARQPEPIAAVARQLVEIVRQTRHEMERERAGAKA